MSDECRFDGPGPGCDTHSGKGAALCTHAAAALQGRVEQAERERDLAIAHDRQPYPTADAYEKVCVALESAKARVRELEEQLGDWIWGGSESIAGLRARLARADTTVGRLREALQVIERLRKRLPDPDFAEQETTARAIGETIHAALAEWG